MKASPAPSTLNTSIGKPLPTMPASRSSEIGAVIDDAAQGAALQHDRGAGDRADRLERFQHAVGARRDHDLLFGADDQIAVRKHASQPRRHGVRLHVALETRVVAGEPPEVRPVVDVEDDLAAVLLGEARSLSSARPRPLGFEKCVPVTTIGAAAGDEVFVDVALVERHVGAVGAIEDHRRDALGLDRKQHQRRQPVLVDLRRRRSRRPRGRAARG